MFERIVIGPAALEMINNGHRWPDISMTCSVIGVSKDDNFHPDRM